jgi:hypothetical protein
MDRPQYTDPMRGRAPTLEKLLVKYRAFQMTLVLFYVEDVRKSIIDCVQSTNRFRATHGGKRVTGKDDKEGVTFKSALQTLVSDRALTVTDRTEIIALVDYRNLVGHEIYRLTEDLNLNRWAHRLVRNEPAYRADAVKRLQYYRKKIGNLSNYVRTLRTERLPFLTTEQVLLAELKRLDKRIKPLITARIADIQRVNAELDLRGTELVEEFHPRGPWSQRRNGTLSPLGIELCYRLFDMGKSEMAVAHLTGLSLSAVRRRSRMWKANGAKRRRQVALADLAPSGRRKSAKSPN